MTIEPGQEKAGWPVLVLSRRDPSHPPKDLGNFPGCVCGCQNERQTYLPETTVTGLVEAMEGLDRFDPEHDESRGQDFALGNDPIVMETYEDGDWLRRDDVLAALSTFKQEVG